MSASPTPWSYWAERGRQAAAELETVHAVAVIADDVDAGAAVARGVAASLSRSRKVTLVDLVGGARPFGDLVVDADAEGVAESFSYGISLPRLSRTTPVANLFLTARGGEPVETEEIFRSGKWRRLAEQHRRAGDLLLVLARSTPPSVCELVQQLDGAIVVGRTTVDRSPPFAVLRRLLEPKAEARAPATWRRRWPWLAALAALAALGAVVAIVGLGLLRSGAEQMRGGNVSPAPPANVTPVANQTSPPWAIPVNPGDSLGAAAFALEILSANTLDGANFELRRHAVALPAGTIAPIPVGAARATWYKVIAGAYVDERQADSLLRVTRTRGALADSLGMLVRVPFALLVDSVPANGPVEQVVASYVRRGIPAYALEQPDGRALVYAGAFQRGEESEILIRQLWTDGLKPSLAYRTGRVF